MTRDYDYEYLGWGTKVDPEDIQKKADYSELEKMDFLRTDIPRKHLSGFNHHTPVFRFRLVLSRDNDFQYQILHPSAFNKLFNVDLYLIFMS